MSNERERSRRQKHASVAGEGEDVDVDVDLVVDETEEDAGGRGMRPREPGTLASPSGCGAQCSIQQSVSHLLCQSHLPIISTCATSERRPRFEDSRLNCTRYATVLL